MGWRHEPNQNTTNPITLAPQPPINNMPTYEWITHGLTHECTYDGLFLKIAWESPSRVRATAKYRDALMLNEAAESFSAANARIDMFVTKWASVPQLARIAQSDRVKELARARGIEEQRRRAVHCTVPQSAVLED